MEADDLLWRPLKGNTRTETKSNTAPVGFCRFWELKYFPENFFCGETQSSFKGFQSPGKVPEVWKHNTAKDIHLHLYTLWLTQTKMIKTSILLT